MWTYGVCRRGSPGPFDEQDAQAAPALAHRARAFGSERIRVGYGDEIHLTDRQVLVVNKSSVGHQGSDSFPAPERPGRGGCAVEPRRERNLPT